MKTPKATMRAAYAVGYGKPPAHARFRKGVSGNPGGRPRGMAPVPATALALREAYRPIPVREGGKVTTLPAIQAVLRSQVALAIKGNGPAQRAMIAVVQAIEQALAAEAAARAEAAAEAPAMSDLEVARRIAFVLSMGAREKGEPQPDNLRDAIAGLLDHDPARKG